MQSNWSLILNILLLISVIVVIVRLMKVRKQKIVIGYPSLGSLAATPSEEISYSDDIIAVRQINTTNAFNLVPHNQGLEQIEPRVDKQPEIEIKSNPKEKKLTSTLMLFLLAKEKRQFAGYELLQTVLASGLRFGEGFLFHRHQFPNGQGPVLCSLAAATETGFFDLQNIGAFSVKGLCLFMHASKNPSIDIERFSIMLETAKQLSEGLDAHLLDDQRKPLTEDRIAQYNRLFEAEY